MRIKVVLQHTTRTMKFVILCACVALAVAQSTDHVLDPTPAAPIPAGRSLPGFGPQPYAGFPQYPIPYQPHIAPAPKSGPPKVEHAHPIGVVPQHYQPQYQPQYQPHHQHHHSHHFIPIVKQTQDIQDHAGYQWEYQAGNGITAYETAQIVPINAEQASKSVHGGYSYTSLEGIPVEVTYTADENGFHPHVVVHTGASLQRHH